MCAVNRKNVCGVKDCRKRKRVRRVQKKVCDYEKMACEKRLGHEIYGGAAARSRPVTEIRTVA